MDSTAKASIHAGRGRGRGGSMSLRNVWYVAAARLHAAE
jgi:hypothetical protein